MGVKFTMDGAEAERRMRSLACARCGAGNGEACVSRTGKRASLTHVLRKYAAVRAGLLPVMYEDGEPVRAPTVSGHNPTKCLRNLPHVGRCWPGEPETGSGGG